MDTKPKKIGVLTSGGDAPGMNAAIRAIVRTAIANGIQVKGIMKGYEGLLSGEIIDLTPKSVSDIIHRGGTILKTARCKEMMTPEGQDKAAQICKVLGIEALVIIGGDGSFNGGLKLSQRGINVICIPATIDLDIACTDYTIGFDTAVNTGMEAINKIRDTSSSHERVSVVEVMGRNAGYIALWCGMTGGAEEVLVPEDGHLDTDSVVKEILENRATGKRHNLIVVAEGIGGSVELAKRIESITGIESRATILGHLQRGGTPTALDRMRASVMGHMAIELIKEGQQCRVIGYKNGQYIHLDVEEGLATKKEYNPEMYEIIKTLSI